jgi:hypothetical protein
MGGAGANQLALAGTAGVANPIDAHRPGNVLDLLLAEILKGKGQAVAHVVVNRIGDEYSAGLGQGLQPRCDIHPVAENVVLLNDHVAEVDADAEPDPLLLRHLGLALGHATLDLHSAAHGVDNAHELSQ